VEVGPLLIAKVAAAPVTSASDFCDGMQRGLGGQRARSTARPGSSANRPRLIISLTFYTARDRCPKIASGFLRDDFCVHRDVSVGQALLRLLAAGSHAVIQSTPGDDSFSLHFDRSRVRRSHDPMSTSRWRAFERTIRAAEEGWPFRSRPLRRQVSRNGDLLEPQSNCTASGHRSGRSRLAPPLPGFRATSASNFLSRVLVSPKRTRTPDEIPNAR